jgi:hypothetical protein
MTRTLVLLQTTVEGERSSETGQAAVATRRRPVKFLRGLNELD